MSYLFTSPSRQTDGHVSTINPLQSGLLCKLRISVLITKWPLGVSVCISYFTSLRGTSSHPPLAEGEARQHRSSAAWHCRFETYLCDWCLHLFPVVVKKKKVTQQVFAFFCLLPLPAFLHPLSSECAITPFLFSCHQHPLFCSVGSVYYTVL